MGEGGRLRCQGVSQQFSLFWVQFLKAIRPGVLSPSVALSCDGAEAPERVWEDCHLRVRKSRAWNCSV